MITGPCITANRDASVMLLLLFTHMYIPQLCGCLQDVSVPFCGPIGRCRCLSLISEGLRLEQDHPTGLCSVLLSKDLFITYLLTYTFNVQGRHLRP